MNKVSFFGLVFLSFVVGSCSDKKKAELIAVPVQEQTPEVLDNTKGEISSISKRYAPDIVENLFNEALQKDNQLKGLTENITKINKSKVDSLKPYWDYNQNNEMYFRTAKEYIGKINDSTLKCDMKAIMKKLEEKYQNRISNHKMLEETLEKRTQTLNDYEILMKLAVTIPMIGNYQKNEIPDIKGLKNLVERYDTIINKTKSYSMSIK